MESRALQVAVLARRCLPGKRRGIKPMRAMSFSATWPHLGGKTTRIVACTMAALLIGGVLGWLGREVHSDLLVNTDELLTAERSREMLLLGPATVHDDFAISVAKPPLQYWLTALTLPRFKEREMAVRIWPLLYAALTAMALAWLAYLVEPARPWLITISVASLIFCPLFLTEAARALLDSGLTFFTTLAIVFAQLARKRPVWWMAVAVVCWLGTLQKVPLILLVWTIIILLRFYSETATWRSGWLIGSVLFAAALLAAWPLLQMAIYGMPLRKILRLGETIHLIGPARLGARPYFEIPIRLFTTWPWGALAFAGIVLHFSKKTKRASALTELMIVSLAIILLAIAFNFRSVRYILPIVPCLCLFTGFFVIWLCEQRLPVWKIAAVIVISFFVYGLVITHEMINERRVATLGFPPIASKVTDEIIAQRRKDALDQKLLAEELGVLENPGTQIVILGAFRNVLPHHFFLFYGNLHFPVIASSNEELEQSTVLRPAMGICAVRDLAVIQRKYPGSVVQSVHGDFVRWDAPALN
jgi:4-amino-4-deoxy-L-arabinose transferase-like glycosyltransferase